MLTSLKISRNKDLLVMKRSEEPKCIATKVKELLDGGKYYYYVMSDGSVVAGRYGSEGDWHGVRPGLINDVFDLTGEQRLWEGSVIINNGNPAFLLQTAYEKLAEKYEFEKEWDALEEEHVVEKELILAKEEEE